MPSQMNEKIPFEIANEDAFYQNSALIFQHFALKPWALRFTLHVFRFTFFASRFTLHVFRFTFFASRFTPHASRLT
jgi:hypothetical protein